MRIRRIIFWVLTALYVLTASMILLFGNGFRLQFSPLRLTRTGNVLITFVPTYAAVFLDAAPVSSSAPTRLRAVFPGEHTIRIVAPGFFPYTHQIRVDAMQTTFLSDIYLIEQHDLVRESATSTPPILKAPLEGTTEALINGSDFMVSSTPTGGTFITKDGAPFTRDLGIGTWRINDSSAPYLALTRLDTGETQFRTWNNPDVVAFTVTGTHMLPQSWNNVSAVSVELVYSPFELWFVNAQSGAATLLARLSKPIITVLPIPQTALALAVLPDEVIAYQLGDTHNTPLSLLRAPAGEEIVNAALTPDGNTLQLVTKKNNIATTWSQVLFTNR